MPLEHGTVVAIMASAAPDDNGGVDEHPGRREAAWCQDCQTWNSPEKGRAPSGSSIHEVIIKPVRQPGTLPKREANTVRSAYERVEGM